MTKVWTIKKIIDQLTPILNTDFRQHTMHMIEEIGEIASVITRSQDPKLPNTIFKLSEVHLHLSKELTDKDIFTSEYARYTEFFRWNKELVGKKFKEKLESELIDVIMMVAIYPILARNKEVEFILKYNDLLEYKFDTKFLHPRKIYDVFLIMKHILREIIHVLEVSMNVEENSSKEIYFANCLNNLLLNIENLCWVYDINVNQGITNKITKDLKEEKRSK